MAYAGRRGDVMQRLRWLAGLCMGCLYYGVWTVYWMTGVYVFFSHHDVLLGKF